MKKEQFRIIDWTTARLDYLANHPDRVPDWANYLKTHRDYGSVKVVGILFLAQKCNVKTHNLWFTQYDVTKDGKERVHVLL